MNNRLKISITGKNPTYFLKEIIKRNINIYKVEKKYKELKVIIDSADLEKILKIKTTYKIKIIERFGISKYKFLLKKYLLLIIFILMGIFLNIILSNLIFDIEITHSNKTIVKTIKNDLKALGLRKYRFKVSYKEKENIKKQLLEKEKDLLEWVEIEEKGTKYIIKVEQRKKNKNEANCNYRHIVSKKNAIIKEIFADSGEIIRKKNDYISKGETIISGLIYNKDNIVSKRCSKGTVYGEVWYTVTLSLPKKINEKKVTSKESLGLSIKTLKKEFNLFNKFRTFEKKEYNIIESKIIPLKISLSKFIKTEENIKNISYKNVDKEALEIATKRIEKNLKSDEKIISKKVLKKNEINSKIKVEVFFKVLENITDYQDITNLNIDELNAKEE